MLTKSRPSLKEHNTQLHGRLLIVTRSIWAIFAVFALTIFVLSIPISANLLQTLCSGASCASDQLSPAAAQSLQPLHISVYTYTLLRVIVSIALSCVWFVVAAILMWRKSNDWMALLIALLLVFFGTNTIVSTISTSQTFLVLPAQFLSFLTFETLGLSFMLFPDGRFVPHWSPVVLLLFTAEAFTFNFFPNLITFSAFLPNLLGTCVWIAILVGLLYCQVYRYRFVSTLVQRQQTKWVIFAFVILIIFEVGFSIPMALVPSFNLPSSPYFLFYNVCEYFTRTLIPLALGIAILRHRLYDIDIIINRTLVYGSLTAILTLLYFGLVLLLQTLLNPLTPNSALAVVGSTLVIAALFQPLRTRIQRLIDRRFYRSKYNATQTIANFSTTLRNEVELDELKAHLVSVVDETMQPTHISLWLYRKRKGE